MAKNAAYDRDEARLRRREVGRQSEQAERVLEVVLHDAAFDLEALALLTELRVVGSLKKPKLVSLRLVRHRQAVSDRFGVGL
jgi:hypothetical protein